MAQSQMILVATGIGLCVGLLTWMISQRFGGICPDPEPDPDQPKVNSVQVGAGQIAVVQYSPEQPRESIPVASESVTEQATPVATPVAEQATPVASESVAEQATPVATPVAEQATPLKQQIPNVGGDRQTRSRYKVKKRKSRKHK